MMQNKYITVLKPRHMGILNKILSMFNLHKVFSSRSLSIWMHPCFKISVDRKLIRINIYDETNTPLIKQIYTILGIEDNTYD